MRRWFLDRDGRLLGPLTLPELYRLLETREACPQDRVQEEGTSNWRLLGDLFAEAGAEPRRHPAGKAGYVLRHWQGGFSLAYSYWVNVVLLSIVFTLATTALTSSDTIEAGDARLAAVLLASVLALVVPVTIWQLVGTWRSADRHVSRGGQRGWAIAAKVLLCLGALRAIADFGMTAATVANAWQHAAAMDALPPERIVLLRNATEIDFAGGIRPGSAERLRKVLAAAPSVRVIHLSGPGGDLGESHAMASAVRARGLDTYARADCMSACTTVFLAGRERLLREGARLGFHAPTAVLAGAEGRRVVQAERRALSASGLPEWFIERAFAVRGDDMWFPTVAELASARIITTLTDGRQLSPGRPASPVSAASVEAMLRRDPLGFALAAANPAAFQSLALRLTELENDGGTVDDGQRMVEQVVFPIFTEAFKRLPDRPLLAISRTVAETARALGQRDARVCRDWVLYQPGRPFPLVAPHLSAQHRDALAQAMALAVTTDADPRQRTAPPPREPPQLRAVTARLEARLTRAQLAVFDDPWRATHAPANVCAAITELFLEILRLPEREAGPLLRFLLNSG